MKNITENDYREILEIFNKKMNALALHEKKNSWFGGVHKNNCICRNLAENIQLFQMFTPSFLSFIRVIYINALKKHPDCFGTGNAKDVIDALYLESNTKEWDEKRFVDFLSNEVFCLLICKKENEFSNDVLRIDLFRKLDECSKNYVFTGGLFHALKHFSVEEQSASILSNQNISLYDVEQLIWPIAQAFFKGNWKDVEAKNTYKSEIPYLGKKFTLVFYREPNSNVSFVKSFIPKTDDNS